MRSKVRRAGGLGAVQARSVAEVLGRPFQRISLGGVRDEVRASSVHRLRSGREFPETTQTMLRQ